MNLTNTASGLIVANALTDGLANANLWDFFTGRRDGKYVAGADGSGRLTLPELITGPNISASFGDTGGTVIGVLKHNFNKNWVPILGTVIGAPIALKVARKFLAKPLINPINRGLKMAGIDGVKF